MHVPRSYQSRVELEELAAVPTQICSPQASKPVMGLVQDSMLACFRWTMSENYLNYRQVMKLLSWTSTYNGVLPEPDDPKRGWKAYSILSTVLPKITLIKQDEEEVNRVKITHGKFEEGVWSSGSVGGKISNIIHATWKDFGPETTRLFMDNMMNLTMQWLLVDGFSIGMIDTGLDQETKTKVDKIINSIYEKVNKKISDLREGKFEVKFSNVGLEEQFENEMFELVNQVRDKAQSVAYNSLSKENRIYATVTSGSKGNKANIVQISSLLGQQGLEGGKRVHGGYSNRTLPHYAKYDLRPESHGLILNNYINGLNPTEYFMHAMSGREGVISTAIKTGITGYIQRKLIKVMEDLKVNFDNTVRNANNFIISHVYATDSFDAAKLERESLKYFNMDPKSAKFRDQYSWSGDDELKKSLTATAYQEWLSDVKGGHGNDFLNDELKQILEDRRVMRKEMYPKRSQHGAIWSPVKFSRLLDWIKYTCNLDKREQGDVSPLEVILKVKALIRDIQVSTDPEVNKICTRHFCFLIRNYLNSKRLIKEHKFTKQALDLILLKVKEHYQDALINPGEMIGCISAQSIGQPLTQLTLDSVAPDERLILQNDDGTTRLVKIGEWIDNLLSSTDPSNIKHFEKNRTEYLELNQGVWTPTPSKEGKFGWHQITAITRHLPGGDLVKITTRGGRSVTATKSKSILVWKNNELVQIGGSEAKVGDLVPVICDFPEPKIIIDHIDLRTYLSPDELVQIPIQFPLDKDFGTIVGLYLAGGWVTDTFVGISNDLPLIQNWCDKYRFVYRETNTKDSNNLEIHSRLLTRWFKVWLNKETQAKQMPTEAFTSNLEFVRGILDGYFARDGVIHTREKYLSISSVSEDLIVGFGVLCSRFGIMGEKSQTENNYTYSIRNSFATKWIEEIGSCHPRKITLMKDTLTQLDNIEPLWKKVNSTILDPIVSIEEVPATEFVYDLTVPETTNFSIWNGLGVADTFHQSGLGGRSKKLNEVPRLREIFSTTANPKTPFVNVYLTSELLEIDGETSNEEVIRRGENFLDRIQYTTLNSLTEGYQIVFDPNEAATIIEEDRAWLAAAHDSLMSSPTDIETPWLIRFKLNSEKIQNIRLTDITRKLEELRTDDINLHIIHTLKNAPEVIIRVRVTTRGEDPKKDLKDLTKRILLTAVKGLPNIMGGSVISEDKDIYVDGQFVSKDSAEYRNQHRYKTPVENKVIDPRNQQYLIQTEGTNLFEIMALDGIDIYQTRCNDLHETLEVLGIEAVRELIVQEIVDVFAYGGVKMNNRHFGLLSDIMTAQGHLVSIDRYGVNKTDTGVLSRATFETTTNQIANASIFGEEDPMRGVSANVMFGQFFQGGTNSCDVLLDEEMILKAAEEGKLYYPKRIRPQKTVDYQETETLASCQNLNFEFSI